jgi:replicative DNA helicase
MVINLNPLIDTLLEEDVIAYLLEHTHSIPEVNRIITSESFTDPLMKASFSTCVELSSVGKVFTRYDVFRALKSKESELNIDSSKVLSLLPKRSIDINQAGQDLKELESLRHLSDISINIQNGLVGGSDSLTIASIIDQGVSKLQDGSRSTEIYSIGQVFDEVIVKMEANAGNTKFSGIDTGSRKLNYALGGWQEGMAVIAARPSMGKTIVGLEHAKSAAMSGKRVLFLSLEMPKESLMYRFISSEAFEYNYSDIKANRITPDDVAKIKLSRAKMLKELPIYFYDSDNRDINYLSNILTAEVRKNKIELVIIDYLQLIRDNQIREQSDFAQVSSVSNKIQKLTKKLRLPIICLSQLSRDIEKRNNRHPQLSDLRSSGNIEQDASVVIGLYRDDYYKYVDAKESGNSSDIVFDYTLRYVILKNRDGVVGDYVRYVDVKTNRVADEESELFGFTQPKVAYQNSAIKSMDATFDKDVTISPF